MKNTAFLAAAALVTALGCQRETGVETSYQQGRVEIYDNCEPQADNSTHQRIVVVRDERDRITLVIQDTECDGNLLQNRVTTFPDGDTMSPLFTRDLIRITSYDTPETFGVYGQGFRELSKGNAHTSLRVLDTLLPCVREELQSDITTQFARAQSIYEDILSQYLSNKSTQQR